jgi:EpsI family protein
MPLQLDDWTGENAELDPKVFQALGADAAVNRVYRNVLGEAVTFHTAYWSNEDLTPHLPQVCYSGAGYAIKSELPVTVDAKQGPIRARLLTCERDGRSNHVLYWYQQGDITYTTRSEGKEARRALWGEKVWPPIAKVMLHTSGLTDEVARKRLTELAAAAQTAIHDIH